MSKFLSSAIGVVALVLSSLATVFLGVGAVLAELLDSHPLGSILLEAGGGQTPNPALQPTAGHVKRENPSTSSRNSLKIATACAAVGFVVICRIIAGFAVKQTETRRA